MRLNPVNILFLDFDGVVNCSDLKVGLVNVRQDGKRHFDTFVPSLCKNVEKLIHEFEFKVVISSSWRDTFDMISMKDIVNNQMDIDCDIIDYTTRHRLDKGYKERFEDNPETAISHERGMQISEWLLEKKYTVNNYLVLDDSLDASYGHEKNYYRVNNVNGFNEQALEEAVLLFNNLLRNIDV